MYKFFLIFLISVFLSSCNVVDFHDYENTVGNLDQLKFLQYYMITDFESSKELAMNDKVPGQMYGIQITENYNLFLNQSKIVQTYFASIIKENSDNKEIFAYYENSYKPVLLNYELFISEFLNKITTTKLTEQEFNDLVENLNTESEKLFYIQVDLVDLITKYAWEIPVFKVKDSQ